MNVDIVLCTALDNTALYNEDAMAKRLITLRQIRAEKYPRGRSTILAEIAAGKFPRPIGGCVPNLWEEDVVDRFVEEFIAKAKERQADGQQRVSRASAARLKAA